jgi:hypothetical protein
MFDMWSNLDFNEMWVSIIMVHIENRSNSITNIISSSSLNILEWKS